MTEVKLIEYIIDDKRYVDVNGVALILGKAVGTVHHLSKRQGFPISLKKGRKIYFEKDEIEKYKKDNEIVFEIKNFSE